MTTTITPPAGLRYPPGPKPGLILGNALQLRNKDVLQAYLEMWQQYGDIVYMKLGPLDAYLLASPEAVNHVLVKNQRNYIKGIGYDSFRLLVGQGLVTSDGELWRQQRKLMAPSFTPSAITQFFEMMVEVTERMIARWQPLVGSGQPIVVDQEMVRLTMSIIGRAMFSIDLGEEMEEVGRAIQGAFAFIPERFNNPLSLPLSVPLPAHQRFKRNLGVIEDFIAARIAEGRRNPEQGDLLSILLKAQDEDSGYQMSEQQLRDEVITLFFAGFETTARSLTWGWYLLGSHPQVYARLQDEARQVLGKRLPTVEDLYRLEYTRMVIDETLRLYPPTAMLARQNLEEDQIGGYSVPPGSLVILLPFAVHRYPGIWPEPERYDPERFSAETASQRPKSAYIPFASGPRVCLGNNFALMEMALAFSMISGRVYLRRVDQQPIAHEFVGTTRPTRPLEMLVEALPVTIPN